MMSDLKGDFDYVSTEHFSDNFFDDFFEFPFIDDRARKRRA